MHVAVLVPALIRIAKAITRTASEILALAVVIRVRAMCQKQTYNVSVSLSSYGCLVRVACHIYGMPQRRLVVVMRPSIRMDTFAAKVLLHAAFIGICPGFE